MDIVNKRGEKSFASQMKMLNKTKLTEQIVILNDLIYFHTRDKAEEDFCYTKDENDQLIQLYEKELKKREDKVKQIEKTDEYVEFTKEELKWFEEKMRKIAIDKFQLKDTAL
jgi:hypothetical protein